MDPAQYQPKCSHFLNLQDGMPAKFQNRKAEGGVDPAQYQAECRHFFCFHDGMCPQIGPKMVPKWSLKGVQIAFGLEVVCGES